MDEEVRRDVLSVLRGAYSAVKGKQFSQLHSLSNRIIHSISVYQEKVLLDVAIVMYSLNKLLEEEKFQRKKAMPRFLKEVLSSLDDAIEDLEERKFKKFENKVHDLLNEVEGFSRKVRFYVQDVLDYARIKKGSKLYEHGLSLGVASKITGMSKWELMEASGGTIVHEEVAPISEKRIRLVRKMFKLEG